jgi:protein-S-isoprenylcysteine O-methyltransferase Ste14
MADTAAAASAVKRGAAQRILQLALTITAWIGGLFLGAGRLGWTRGWISVGLYVAGLAAVGVVLRRKNPELIAERAKWLRKDTKSFDKVFIATMLPLATVQPLIAGMDAGRFHWSSVAFAWVYPAALLFALAMALVGWTLAVNRHAETTVRIQTDRGHSVVTWGPYRFVRHPMYAGAILMYVATPLVWGSVAALGISAAIIVLFIWRTVMEDRALRCELPGYAEYASRTRFRLVPGLW